MPPSHPLDRPVWAALFGRQAPLSLGDGRARRMHPDYGPFAAAASYSPDDLAGLSDLSDNAEGLALVEPEGAPLPAAMEVLGQAPCWQMQLRSLTADACAPPEILPLGDADAAEMLALATLTKPGPFATRTHALGRFLGVKRDGRLIAMAGERMQPEGFTEVSGVCALPEARGQGLAGALMRAVIANILKRGEVPILHAYAENQGAIQLYQRLGFTYRRTLILTRIRPQSPGESTR